MVRKSSSSHQSDIGGQEIWVTLVMVDQQKHHQLLLHQPSFAVGLGFCPGFVPGSAQCCKLPHILSIISDDQLELASVACNNEFYLLNIPNAALREPPLAISFLRVLSGFLLSSEHNF